MSRTSTTIDRQEIDEAERKRLLRSVDRDDEGGE